MTGDSSEICQRQVGLLCREKCCNYRQAQVRKFVHEKHSKNSVKFSRLEGEGQCPFLWDQQLWSTSARMNERIEVSQIQLLRVGPKISSDVRHKHEASTGKAWRGVSWPSVLHNKLLKQNKGSLEEVLWHILIRSWVIFTSQ